MKKKKKYIGVKKVREFISNQPEISQAEYQNIIQELEYAGRLIEPFGKRLEKDLFKIRVRRGKNIRVFYFYTDDDYIFGVHAFIKKSQKTPIKEIKKDKKIIKEIKQGIYHE